MLRTEPSAVVLENLTVAVGSKVVLRSVSYAFSPSAVTVVLGPNGVGKTTLLRTLTGTLRPRSGNATLFGRPAGSLEAKAQIGYLAEQRGLYERLTAYENLLFHARIRGMGGISLRRDAEALLEEVGLREERDTPVHRFSKGMKQRLAVARTFMGEPPVLLLDEPTSGLDPDGSELVVGKIKEHARKGGTVIMTTHNAYLARRMAGEVLLLRQGTVAARGPFEEVLRPYGRIRVRLLEPVRKETIANALRGRRLLLPDAAETAEFEVEVAAKADVPEVIAEIVEGGLKPVSVEPGEISYEEGEKKVD
jgi:ABC-2 type transport system ATP-binding protein